MFSSVRLLIAACAGIGAGLGATPADALVITPATGLSPDVALLLANTLLGGNPDFDLVPGSATYQGNVANNANGGTYTGFSLSPGAGVSKPTFNLGDGIVLSSSVLSQIPSTNTENAFSRSPGSGSNALLTSIAPGNVGTNDANVLGFKVTRKPASTATAIAVTFQFMTDEFPTQSVTDIFGFFVDGTNFARFADGSVVANQPGNPSNQTNFTLNPVNGGQYPIEFNGLSAILQVVGVLNPNAIEHQVFIGIADTSDTIFDSIVFVTGLGGSQGDGGIVVPPVSGVPVPGTLALVGVGVGVTLLSRRRRARR